MSERQVWIKGENVKQMRGKFPRGFILRVVNDTAAVLCRHRFIPNKLFLKFIRKI